MAAPPPFDLPALRAALAEACDAPADCRALFEARPHLFAPSQVTLSAETDARMRAIIRTVEAVATLPAYREAALARAPAIARRSPGALGVCFGYDFHLVGGEPKLIEINTNAGGGVLNALRSDLRRSGAGGECIAGLAAMFREEWQREGRDPPLRTIALVDDDPAGQYLYPEFLLFQGLMRRQGIAVAVADAAALEHRAGRLWLGDLAIDLVYNRLTDFMLDSPGHAALRRAYEAGAVVLTPHPQVHALYADKRNLVLLGDSQRLRGMGVAEEALEVLARGIPPAVEVTPANAETLWQARRRWFFKPTGGFGGRGAYRGEKLTRKVWQGLLEAPYIAQGFVPPDPVGDLGLKMDLRYYVYAGTPRLPAARLYQGQTTNFRTPSGGFAPVIVG